MKKKDPDFAYINTNTQWVPVVLKDSHKLGLKTKYVVNNYGIDERTPEARRGRRRGRDGHSRTSPTGARTSRA